MLESLIVHYTSKGNQQGLKTNLDLLEETRLTTPIRNEAYRHRTTQYHNARFKNRKFKLGNLLSKK